MEPNGTSGEAEAGEGAGGGEGDATITEGRVGGEGPLLLVMEGGSGLCSVDYDASSCCVKILKPRPKASQSLAFCNYKTKALPWLLVGTGG